MVLCHKVLDIMDMKMYRTWLCTLKLTESFSDKIKLYGLPNAISY